MKYDLKRQHRQGVIPASAVYWTEWMKQIAKNLSKR